MRQIRLGKACAKRGEKYLDDKAVVGALQRRLIFRTKDDCYGQTKSTIVGYYNSNGQPVSNRVFNFAKSEIIPDSQMKGIKLIADVYEGIHKKTLNRGYLIFNITKNSNLFNQFFRFEPFSESMVPLSPREKTQQTVEFILP